MLANTCFGKDLWIHFQNPKSISELQKGSKRAGVAQTCGTYFAIVVITFISTETAPQPTGEVEAGVCE